jgi:hypothetical protein
MSEEKKPVDVEAVMESPGLTDHQKNQIACSEEIRAILSKHDLAFSVRPGDITLVERPEDMKDKIVPTEKELKEDK